MVIKFLIFLNNFLHFEDKDPFQFLNIRVILIVKNSAFSLSIYFINCLINQFQSKKLRILKKKLIKNLYPS